MRSILTLILAMLFLVSVDASDRYSKAKGRGAWAFAIAKSQCACGDSCPCAAQPAAKPEPVVIDPPHATGTVNNAPSALGGSCASGSCSSGSFGGSTSYSSGLFRRRR